MWYIIKVVKVVFFNFGVCVMKEIIVIEFVFVICFFCFGLVCCDYCCKGWKIMLDKMMVKKYFVSKDVMICIIV